MAPASATPTSSHADQPPQSAAAFYALVCLRSSPLPAPPLVPHLVPHLDARPSGEPEEDSYGAWLAACYRLTPRLERLDATRALLDLGACTAAEAHAAALGLLRHLDTLCASNTADARGTGAARIGLGPSPLLAQLALFAAETAGRIATLASDTTPAVSRTLPVRLLPRLHPAGTFTLETVERLESYGLRTLGQIARLGEPALRRQFGERLGALLSAVAAGRDIRPLQPTPQPATRRFRLPFAPAATPEDALAALPALAHWIAWHLADERLQASTPRLLLVWESGAATAAQTRLRAPIHAADPLARHLQRLAAMLVRSEDTPAVHDTATAAIPPDEGWASIDHGPQRVARIVVELADLCPLAEAQGVFWETAERKRAALAELADTLARCYARPALLHAVRTRPHAIFRAERYELRPLGEASLGGGGETGRTGDVSPALGPYVGEPSATPWDAVPHRLHWW